MITQAKIPDHGQSLITEVLVGTLHAANLRDHQAAHDHGTADGRRGAPGPQTRGPRCSGTTDTRPAAPRDSGIAERLMTPDDRTP